jgi:cell division protein FtsB
LLLSRPVVAAGRIQSGEHGETLATLCGSVYKLLRLVNLDGSGAGVSIGREIRRRVKAAVPPVVFLLLVAYFVWNATQGDRGLRAYAGRLEDLKAAQADLARAETDLANLERRVAALRVNRLDPDALDERARAMLNRSDPADLVVLYGQGKRLY